MTRPRAKGGAPRRPVGLCRCPAGRRSVRKPRCSGCTAAGSRLGRPACRCNATRSCRARRRPCARCGSAKVSPRRRRRTRDATQTQPYAHRGDVCRSHLYTTKSSSRQEAAIVQKRRCETSSSAHACAAVAGNPRILLQASRTLKKRDAGARLPPSPRSNSGTPFVPLTLLPRRSRQHATHSSAPTTRDLVNVPRTSLLASGRRGGRPRRHAGGRRPASAARRACRRLVILEIRRVLELVLGPADFELDHGGVVIAADHGGVATSAGAAAGVGGNRLECAHIDGDTLFADAEEPAHAHDQAEDLAVLVEQHVTHVANVRVVRAEDIGAFELEKIHWSVPCAAMNFAVSCGTAGAASGFAAGRWDISACARAPETINALTAAEIMSVWIILCPPIGFVPSRKKESLPGPGTTREHNLAFPVFGTSEAREKGPAVNHGLISCRALKPAAQRSLRGDTRG